MGCSCKASGIESDTGMGILGNHAYSILQCVKVGNHRLIQIRNPWGYSYLDFHAGTGSGEGNGLMDLENGLIVFVDS